MQLFNKTERELRKLDDTKIARVFTCSPFIYGADSRQRERNPEYHPLIAQTEEGAYVTVDGDSIEEDTIPQYILEQGPPPAVTPMGEREDLTMTDYMKESFGLTANSTIYQQPNGTFTADLQGRIRLKVVGHVTDSSKPGIKPGSKRGPGRPRKAA